MPLTLPILWNTDSATELLDLGIEPNEEPTYKQITFYDIDFIHESAYGNKKFPCTLICSGGEKYLVKDTVQNINLAILSRLT